MISALAGIPNVQGVRVLLDGDVTGIAAACLAIGVLPDAFKAVIKMRASRLNFGATQIQKEVETYSDLTNEGVERALRQLGTQGLEHRTRKWDPVSRTPMRNQKERAAAPIPLERPPL